MRDNHAYARTPDGGFYVTGGYRSAFSGKPMPYQRLARPPRFVPAHTDRGWNGTAHEWEEPDAIRCERYTERVFDGRVDLIRVLDDAASVAAILAIDEERATIQKRLAALVRLEQKALSRAWFLSAGVTVEQAKATEPRP